MTEVVPVVVCVVVNACGVFHLRKACRVLLTTRKAQVVVWKFATIFLCERYHTLIDVGLVFCPITIEHLAESGLAEVTGVVEDDVEDNLHTALVCFFDNLLETNAFGLIAMVHFREIVCMVAVVVITRGVLYDRSNPDSGEAKCLDVVHLLDETFEVTTPSRIARVVTIPTVGVIRCVAVKETGCHHEID